MIRSRNTIRNGFTLIEVLVVTAILALLMAILLPSLRTARRQARIVVTHSDLRQITVALDAYSLLYKDRLPLTRSGCDTTVYYQLPIELAREKFLPKSPDDIPQAHMADQFHPEYGYKYRAPGPQYLNGTLIKNWETEGASFANIFVPDDYPRNDSSNGKYYYNETNTVRQRVRKGIMQEYPPSPVRYAVWSMGPDLLSRKYPQSIGTNKLPAVMEATFPLPRAYWLTRANDTGLITHFKSRNGAIYTSP